MKQITRKVLSAIKRETRDGTAQGFDLFDKPELHRIADIPIERLHNHYGFESAVRYLATLVPGDAKEIESETRVEL